MATRENIRTALGFQIDGYKEMVYQNTESLNALEEVMDYINALEVENSELKVKANNAWIKTLKEQNEFLKSEIELIIEGFAGRMETIQEYAERVWEYADSAAEISYMSKEEAKTAMNSAESAKDDAQEAADMALSLGDAAKKGISYANDCSKNITKELDEIEILNRETTEKKQTWQEWPDFEPEEEKFLEATKNTIKLSGEMHSYGIE